MDALGWTDWLSRAETFFSVMLAYTDAMHECMHTKKKNWIFEPD